MKQEAGQNLNTETGSRGITSGRSVVSYMLLPGIMPQIKELTRGGFGYLAFLIAFIYQSVKILPADHPYTQPQNVGHFGIRDVIAVSANNVKFDRQHIDQVIIFFAIISGIILLFFQALGFLFLVLSGDAFAGTVTPDSFGGLFHTANPDKDLAFHMMREVFGLPDMFGALSGGGPTAFHLGLHAMFQFYNMALLLVAVLIFLYYVIVVVAETAQTGTPFGKRFSNIYAPIRLVVAIGLLVPLNYGFNGAQYITFYAAKLGSGFATTGWTQFNKSLEGSNPLGAENATLIGESKAPGATSIINFMALTVTCREAHYKADPSDTGPEPMQCFSLQRDPDNTKAWKTKSGCDPDGIASTHDDSGGDLILGFGRQVGDEFVPHCGTVLVPITASFKTEDGEDSTETAVQLQKDYIRFIKELWEDTTLAEIGRKFACSKTPYDRGCSEDDNEVAARDELLDFTNNKRDFIRTAVMDHYQRGREEADMTIRQETLDRGWGGAGIWYNRIAQMNGQYVSVAMNIPQGKNFPLVMKEVLEQKQQQDVTFDSCTMFQPNLADEQPVELDERDMYYARVLYEAHKGWACENTERTDNMILDAMSGLFGLNGLMSIRQTYNSDGSPADCDSPGDVEIHPLAKLSVLGKGLMDNAVSKFGWSVGLAVGGEFVGGVFNQHLGKSAVAASAVFSSVATIGLSIGFITYYILPFMPFMYFFFAVGGWVKGIFEAMVGAPLWALAHLRIDGDGLSGKMASQGYFLIFEIFLRPILTVFGLLGGMAIFTIMAHILNEVFDLVVSNAAGVDLCSTDEAMIGRHIIDQFFFTCLYAIILYLMATSSFKMINLVPNGITRWLGAGVQTFNDGSEDPTGNLVQYAAISGAKIGGDIAGGVRNLGLGLGQSLSGGGIAGAERRAQMAELRAQIAAEMANRNG